MQRPRQQLLRRTRTPAEGTGLFCNYTHRVCMQTRLEGFDFCLKHILEDKTSPFKQCSYISAKTNRRCGNAAPRADRREGYCLDHARKSCILRQQAGRKRRPKETAESLLEELGHYSTTKSGETEVKRSRVGESLASKILEYGSSSDSSDTEMPIVEQAWRGDGDSDAESIDSEQEDPLKHAGIYTAEEVTLIMRDKLIRLQSLYIEQFKRLQHILKEKRRKYLHTTKLDKDSQGVHAFKADQAAQGKLAKLTALKRYHQRHGKEALLQRQSKERRVAVSEGVNYKPPAFPKCAHSTAGSRCNGMSLPLTKFCVKHVVDDPHQVLYQPCSFAQGECGKPVTVYNSPLLCDVHKPLPEPTPHSVNDSEEQPSMQERDPSGVSSVDMQPDIAAVGEGRLPTLATQTSLLSAVSATSDALSASSDTLSATLDEPYISSDVPSASSDIPSSFPDTVTPSSTEVPLIGVGSADVKHHATDLTLGTLPEHNSLVPNDSTKGLEKELVDNKPKSEEILDSAVHPAQETADNSISHVESSADTTNNYMENSRTVQPEEDMNQTPAENATEGTELQEVSETKPSDSSLSITPDVSQ